MAVPHQFLEFRAMGSVCAIRVHQGFLGVSRVREAVNRAAAEVIRVEKRYSRYRATSVLSLINARAGHREPVAIDAETAGLLRFAGQMHQRSQGLFDVTSGVLRRAWRFDDGKLPSSQELMPLLERVGWQHVELTDTHVRLSRVGMELDFGGFGKEYAADRAASLLQDAGLKHGYVNLGGDIRVLGPQPDGSAWSLGIAHPRRPGTLACRIGLTGGSLATSGDYERFMEVEGQRYCHILNPMTGWPVNHWQSMSVIAPSCLAAGVMSTVAMLMGDRAAAFLSEQGVSWIGIDASGAPHGSGSSP
ncbi:FAD:protein FMN transferase [Roseateles amylovorans]|uniref:FAD:protein FMN transferase n=1 Tax=Roseateles amylovorans TaxID=2978473 RepID=A0ABY6B4N5_9BURK|nr:FAD:protein FMN transferase [Roseateles amylovorans]UXH80326.1 FAD:protein FMN transferase [Roseateles amylovorans]